MPSPTTMQSPTRHVMGSVGSGDNFSIASSLTPSSEYGGSISGSSRRLSSQADQEFYFSNNNHLKSSPESSPKRFQLV